MNIREIRDPSFLKELNIDQLNQLAADIREFLIDSVSKTGGHLASNLGIVELTIALHYAFDAPKDRIFFDVGHQSYVHKILTGRAKDFDHLRQLGGISGFQKFAESEYDCWEAGHSSTSLSAALGMAIARDYNNEKYHVVPVIGDGALANGISFEALNSIGSLNKKVIIILNDNNMSISENNFAFEKTLTKMRLSRPYVNFKSNIKNSFFKSNDGYRLLKPLITVRDWLKNALIDESLFLQWNIDYIGPVDGHDISQIIKALEVAKTKSRPIVIHVVTKKGKGYKPAEDDEIGIWHGVGKFDPKTGVLPPECPAGNKTYSEIYADLVYAQAEKDDKVVVITPAMLIGSKLQHFQKSFPKRFFDTGITEEHSAILAASLAVNGLKPYFFVYSSFSQRCYDQINHEISRMNLPVKILLDRASLVGADGETHHGVFDISIYSSLPNMVIAQAADYHQAADLIETFADYDGPVIIRFPKYCVKTDEDYKAEKLKVGKWFYQDISDHVEETVITYGDDYHLIIDRARLENLPLRVVNSCFIKPLDTQLLDEIADLGKPVHVFTSDMLTGGLGSMILEYYSASRKNVELHDYGIGDHFVTHGSVQQLREKEHVGLDDLFAQLICKKSVM